MNEIELKKNGITTIKDAYKLGFFHGAIAMLRYFKAYFTGPANETMPEKPKAQKLLGNGKSSKHVGDMVKFAHSMAKKYVKLRMAGSNKKQFYCIETTYSAFDEESYNGFEIPHVPRADVKYVDAPYEDKAIKLLHETRCKLIIETIKEIKNRQYLKQQNKRLSKL